MTFEEMIAESVAVFDPVQKSARKGAAAATSAGKMVDGGDIRNISKKLDEAEGELLRALEGLREFKEKWEQHGFDDYFASEEYVEELAHCLDEVNVDHHSMDDVIYIYPVLLRLDPAARSVRIDKKNEVRVRPQVLARTLRDIQNKPNRFPAGQFLRALFKVYKSLASANLKKSEPWTGKSILLRDIYEMLSAMPGANYSEQEFARDLYLLDGSGATLEIAGCLASLEASSGTRDDKKTLSIVTRDGQRRLYCTIRFDSIAG
jgi:hypothetical protein